ncbi:hypothetical protein RF11_13656 [Thelohanellus kitauei]|uniref:MULE transposase domain-containing protein n=1 Tax=Thelohanellus kitauei TaxID=669202 RepID=A0A0C2JCS5_THEKT|nr:hypothetical protein RF11_13656 [Thelohanellus kitauei]
MRDGTSYFRLIMWAHPQLLLILSRQSITAFLDGTFKCVPHLFKQCLILMVFDDETDLYVPVIYCLVQNKNEWTFWHFFHFIIVATNMKFNPACIVADFERGLMNSIRDQFPNTNIRGCFFSF